MNKTKSEFKLKCEELERKAFTDEVLNNSIIYDCLFDEFEIDTFRNVEIYDNGQILSLDIELTEDNKKITDKFINDYQAYKELTKHYMDYEPKDDLIDLAVLISFVYDNFKEEIYFDKNKDVFYYN